MVETAEYSVEATEAEGIRHEVTPAETWHAWREGHPDAGALQSNIRELRLSQFDDRPRTEIVHDPDGAPVEKLLIAAEIPVDATVIPGNEETKRNDFYANGYSTGRFDFERCVVDAVHASGFRVEDIARADAALEAYGEFENTDEGTGETQVDQLLKKLAGHSEEVDDEAIKRRFEASRKLIRASKMATDGSVTERSDEWLRTIASAMKDTGVSLEDLSSMEYTVDCLEKWRREEERDEALADIANYLYFVQPPQIIINVFAREIVPEREPENLSLLDMLYIILKWTFEDIRKARNGGAESAPSDSPVSPHDQHVRNIAETKRHWAKQYSSG